MRCDRTIRQLEFNCFLCGKQCFGTRKKIFRCFKEHREPVCSRRCYDKFCSRSVTMECENCSRSIVREPASLQPHNFCSRSCSATYHNTHKVKGIRRSKLEIWLEAELTKLYPSLVIVYNGKETIGTELDIYFPSLKLAFELNGILHYEAIYGLAKLKTIKNNDKIKKKKCKLNNIKLFVINTNKHKKFDPATSMVYLDKIIKEINRNLCGHHESNVFSL